MKRSKSNNPTSNKITAPVAPARPARALPAVVESTPTTIEAKIDVGFGNNLFLRGQGGGLSWERGTPLTCVGPNRWRWSTQVTDNLTFKLLLNDQNWAVGENLEAKPGARVEVSPSF